LHDGHGIRLRSPRSRTYRPKSRNHSALLRRDRILPTALRIAPAVFGASIFGSRLRSREFQPSIKSLAEPRADLHRKSWTYLCFVLREAGEVRDSQTRWRRGRDSNSRYRFAASKPGRVRSLQIALRKQRISLRISRSNLQIGPVSIRYPFAKQRRTASDSVAKSGRRSML